MIAPATRYEPHALQHERPFIEPQSNQLDAEVPGKLTRFATKAIATHPVVSLAAAGVLGIALGWLVKRR